MIAAEEVSASRQRFSMKRATFPSDGVGDSRRLHQICLVGGVDKHFGGINLAGAGFERLDATIFFRDGGEGLVEDRRNLLLGQHGLQSVSSDMRFKGPTHFLSIVTTHPLKKLFGQASNQMFLPIHIGPAQPPRQHPAQVPTRLQKDDAGSISSGGDSGGDAGGSRPIDDDIGRLGYCRRT